MGSMDKLFEVFKPLESFPPRLEEQKVETSVNESLESSILLKEAMETALNNWPLENSDEKSERYPQYISTTHDHTRKCTPSERGYAIPIMIPIRWPKHNIHGNEDRMKRRGVNHLNLIQIMGRTAHTWQPWFHQDPFRLSPPVIKRPVINNVIVNKILLNMTQY